MDRRRLLEVFMIYIIYFLRNVTKFDHNVMQLSQRIIVICTNSSNVESLNVENRISQLFGRDHSNNQAKVLLADMTQCVEK